MKTIDKYLKFKEMYKDHVVIIKSGNFYYTFDDDTYIMNYFFGYQIRENKIGFPLNAKAKVKSVLNRNNVNLIEVIDDYAYILESKNDNAYQNKLREAKSNMLVSNMLNNLMNAIEIKVKKEEANYELIKEFVDEL
ncbi:unknown [Mycoplasma sp. CAG:776]|nr:unknown [Mycoplasma sp. CAG:776]